MSIRTIALAVTAAAAVGFGSAAEASADPISPQCHAAFEQGSLAGHQCESNLHERRQAQGQQNSPTPVSAPAPTPQVPRSSESELPTPKEICAAWEKQVNVEWGTKSDICKYIPSK
jgi:hypothetical protein